MKALHRGQRGRAAAAEGGVPVNQPRVGSDQPESVLPSVGSGDRATSHGRALLERTECGERNSTAPPPPSARPHPGNAGVPADLVSLFGQRVLFPHGRGPAGWGQRTWAAASVSAAGGGFHALLLGGWVSETPAVASGFVTQNCGTFPALLSQPFLSTNSRPGILGSPLEKAS